MIPTTVETPMTNPARTKNALPLRRIRFFIDICLSVIVFPLNQILLNVLFKYFLSSGHTARSLRANGTIMLISLCAFAALRETILF
jgi:hypothetical protein